MMYCYNCNKKISEDEKVCPYCNTVIDAQRCPECWTKLPVNQKICDKCGCDIVATRKARAESANYKEPTLGEKIAKLSLWIKIGVPALAVCLVVTVMSIFLYVNNKETERAKDISREYINAADAAIAQITEIAEIYEEKVYNDDWLTHIETAQELREDNAGKISAIKKAREPISYYKDRIADAGNEEISRLAEDVYYCYTACYGYVIGENGKYPHYLKNYNKLCDKYEKAVEKLEDAIK